MAETRAPQVSDMDVQSILATIKEVESGGDYGIKAKGSSASGAYQFINDTWNRFTKKYGVGTEYKTAAEAPPEVQDEVAALKVRDILKQVGGDVTKVPLVWYTGNPQGRISKEALAANQGLAPDAYQQKWMEAYSKRQQGAPTSVARSVVQEPRTSVPLKPSTAPGPMASPEQLPENYRLALAANYIADTEDNQSSVTDKAMEFLQEYADSQSGGAVGPAVQKTFQAYMGQESTNPFEILAQAQPQPEQKRRVVPKMPVKFSKGGEAQSPQEDFLNPEERDETRKKSQEMLFNLRTNVGPFMAQFVPGANRSVDVRASTPVGPIRPFVDIDPTNADLTQVGATYGNIGPQGGYEVGVSQRAPMDTPQGKIRMPVTAQGAYRMPVGKMGSVEAQGYYVPRQGQMPQSAYGANVRYVQRFEKGGEVNPADIAEQMTVGTLPPDQTPAGQVFTNIGRDVVRGTQYLPYDLVGMPVDIATMAMRPFGYNVEKPFLGSEYLIDKAVQAGIADKPTGSTAETTARIGMGFVNPAMVARQTGRGVEALKDVITAPINRAKIQAAAAKAPEETAYAPLRERLESQGIVALATRPMGSPISTVEPIRKFNEALRSQFDSVLATDKNLAATGSKEAFQAANQKYGTVIEQANQSFIPKLENYLVRQYGTVNDPVYNATVTGKFTPKSFYSPNKVFSWDRNEIAKVTNRPLKDDKLSMDHVFDLQKLAGEGNKDASMLLGRAYDIAGPTRGVFPLSAGIEMLKKPDVFSFTASFLNKYKTNSLGGMSGEDALKAFISQKGVPQKGNRAQEELFGSIKASLDSDIRMQKGRELRAEVPEGREITTLSFGEIGNLSDFSISELTPQILEDIRRGKTVYKISDVLYGGNVDNEAIVEYMFKNPPEKWSKMSVPELIFASQQTPAKVTNPLKVARMADDGVELMPFQRIMGTQSFIPVKSQMLGKGAEWREITTKEGMKIEGAMMDHCLKKNAYGYCSRLMNKESRYFSLRDADGQPFVTIEVTKPIGQEKENVPMSVVKQVKGFYNKPAVPAYGEEISDFFDAWEKQVGVKLRFSENEDFLPEKFKPQRFGIEPPAENFRHGGMVDKPLYDRAA